jgi:hypothetical protein
MIPLFSKRILLGFVVALIGTVSFSTPISLANPPESKIFSLPLPIDGKKHVASKVYVSFPYQALNIPISKLGSRKLDESEKILNAFLQSILNNDYSSGRQYILPVGFDNEKSIRKHFDELVKDMKTYANPVLVGKINLGNNDVRFALKGTLNGKMKLKLIPLYRDKNGTLGIRIVGFMHNWESLLKNVIYHHLLKPSDFPLHSKSVFDRYLYPHFQYQFSRNVGEAFLEDRFNPSGEKEKVPFVLHFQGKVINGNALSKKDMASDPYLRFFRRVHQYARFDNWEELLNLFTPKSRKRLETQNMEHEAKGIHGNKYVIFFISADPFGIVFTTDRPIKKLADIGKPFLWDYYIYRNQKNQYLLTNHFLSFGLQQIIIGAQKGQPFFDEIIAPELKKKFKK